FAQAERLVGADLFVGLVRPVRVISARGGETHAARVPGARDKILIVDLVEMRTLAHAGVFGEEDVRGTGDRVSQRAVESRDVNVLVAPDDVHFAVVVEQDREIVKRPLHRRARPRTTRALRGEVL